MPGLGKSGTSRIRDLRWSIRCSHENADSRTLALNSECGIPTGRFEVDLFELIDDGPLRSGGEIVFECFDAVRRSFGQCFYRPVRTVAHITDDLMSRRSTLCKETITNALHFASYQKLSRNSRHHLDPSVLLTTY